MRQRGYILVGALFYILILGILSTSVLKRVHTINKLANIQLSSVTNEHFFTNLNSAATIPFKDARCFKFNPSLCLDEQVTTTKFSSQTENQIICKYLNSSIQKISPQSYYCKIEELDPSKNDLLVIGDLIGGTLLINSSPKTIKVIGSIDIGYLEVSKDLNLISTGQIQINSLNKNESELYLFSKFSKITINHSANSNQVFGYFRTELKLAPKLTFSEHLKLSLGRDRHILGFITLDDTIL